MSRDKPPIVRLCKMTVGQAGNGLTLLVFGSVLIVGCQKPSSDSQSTLNASTNTSVHLETKRKATSKTASEKVENTKGNSMSEEDLREAIIDLLKKYPGSFGATIEQIQTAKIEHRDGYVQIGFFRCNLKSCTFAYGVFPTGPGQFKGGIGGAFFKDDNGKWTGKITRSIKT